jgi:uncharacterized protein (DUF885 family)
MYDYLVGVNTTTTKTPDEIYQTGLREVERITKEIALQIKNRVSGDRKAFFNHALTDPSFFLSLLMNKYWKVTEQYFQNRT